ncbi:hypothetical protein AVMA1855_20500 [Acidovorax sp. SUPP1855]|uniref:hypothetical protein n=1 Tax=Acidovorax sp. SUPP1855 TaxID=431774 RepID=UPI0023DE5F1C|nr:hypothetical protein [Acidovorax sp. SUPP1855]GKS86574.1 hypothetical protein AVMA1855_20500 [Acidovorax sp. SUPP1855]
MNDQHRKGGEMQHSINLKLRKLPFFFYGITGLIRFFLLVLCFCGGSVNGVLAQTAIAPSVPASHAGALQMPSRSTVLSGLVSSNAQRSSLAADASSQSCVPSAAYQSFKAQCDAFGAQRIVDMAACHAAVSPEWCGSIGVLAEVREEPTRLICFWDGALPPVVGGAYTSGIPYTLPCSPVYAISLMVMNAVEPGKGIPVYATVTHNGQPAAGISITAVESPTPLGGSLSCPNATDSNGAATCSYQSPAKGSTSVRRDQVAATCADCQNTARTGVTLLGLNICPAPGSPGASADGGTVGNPIRPATGEKSQFEADYIDQGQYPLSVIRNYRTAFGENGLAASWDWAGSARIAGDALVSHVLFDGGQVRSFLYESVGSTGSYGCDPSWNRLTPMRD